MELRVQELTVPSVGFNKADLAQAITVINDRYKNTVVVDKALAKRDRAEINKLLKAIDTERKEVKRRLMQPYTEFEAELADIIAPLEESRDNIDRQIKAIEEQERADKRFQIEAMFEKTPHPAEVKLDDVMQSEWLNATCTMKRIEAEMQLRIFEAVHRDKPGELAAELEKANPLNTYTVTPNGIEVAAKIKEHKITVMCSDKRYDDLLKMLDDGGYFYMTEEE